AEDTGQFTTHQPPLDIEASSGASARMRAGLRRRLAERYPEGHAAAGRRARAPGRRSPRARRPVGDPAGVRARGPGADGRGGRRLRPGGAGGLLARASAQGPLLDEERPFDVCALGGTRTPNLLIRSRVRDVRGGPETVSDLGGRLSEGAVIPELSSPVRSRC